MKETQGERTMRSLKQALEIARNLPSASVRSWPQITVAQRAEVKKIMREQQRRRRLFEAQSP